MAAGRRKVLLGIGVTMAALLVLSALAGIIYYKRLTEARSHFRSLKTHEAYKDIYALKSGWFINAWVFKTNCGLIAFDSGLRPEDVRGAMEEVDLDPLRVTHVFLTHTDKEHV